MMFGIFSALMLFFVLTFGVLVGIIMMSAIYYAIELNKRDCDVTERVEIEEIEL